MPTFTERFTICPEHLHPLGALPFGLAFGAKSVVIESLIHGDPFISRAEVIGPL
jgi:hypothetical protein